MSRLASVRRRRQPFQQLGRRIVAQTLAQHLPPEGAVIEIGAGDGQLRERLPAEVLQRVTHTEPQAKARAAFAARYPNVPILQAGAERLPFEDGQAAAVVAQCVLDVVPDGAAVARELARVLRPGGKLIHWLDMSTVLTPIVATLAGTDLVPFPNVFGEPVASAWPEDLFLVARGQLELIAGVLGEHSHELARPLAQYLAHFSASPMRVEAAVAELIQLQEASEVRSALKLAFRSAHSLAPPEIRRQLASFQGRPVSSARHFEQRLRSWFGESSGFRVEQSSVERAWETTPKGERSFSYMSCCIGNQRLLPYVPKVLLCAEAALDKQDDTLIELGVYVFVASRI